MKYLYRRFLSLIIYFLCLFLPTHATNIDSLTNLLDTYQGDTNRVRVLNQLADATNRSDSKASRDYAEEALALAQTLKYKPGQAESHFLLTYAYYFLAKDELAKTNGEKCIEVAKELKNQKMEADANYILGHVLVVMGETDAGAARFQACADISEELEYEEGLGKGLKGLGDIAETKGEHIKALGYYEKSLEIEIKRGSKFGQMASYNDLGRIYDQKMGKYDEGLKHYLLALEIAEELEDKRNMAGFYGNIASVHLFQKNYEKSTEYATKRLNLARELEDQRGEASALRTLGNIQFAQQQYEKALDYFLKAAEIREKLKRKRDLSYAYYNLGKTYAVLKDNRNAYSYHQKSLNLREEIDYKVGIASSSRELANLYLNSNDYRNALNYHKKALEQQEALGVLLETSRSYQGMVAAYEGLKDYRNALIYQKKFTATQDSLFKKEQSEQILDMQTKYETEQKENEILTQRNEILELEAANAKVARQRNSIIGGSIFAAALALLGFQLYKTRKDRNSKIAFAQALMLGQEDERKRLARDLHDGIGQSLLLIKKQLASNQQVSQENQALVAETLEEVRSISRDLHPFQLEKFGLTAAIEGAIEKIEKHTDLFITTEIENIDKRIGPEQQIHIFRTVQEALSNIVKHAEATAAKISAELLPNETLILIQDNGKGFDHELEIVTSQSLGLKTMYERIAAIGGTLRIMPGEPKGTGIEIRMPV